MLFGPSSDERLAYQYIKEKWWTSSDTRNVDTKKRKAVAFLSFWMLVHFACAQDETRTHTILRSLPPQSSVYTNFTTCASSQFACDYIIHVPRTGLEPAHLAACAPETHASTNSAIWASKNKNAGTGPAWSDERDSNSRPRPWQGRALPTELSSHSLINLMWGHVTSFRKRVQRYCFFLNWQNIFTKKCKKMIVFYL